ncbi:MAG: B12-binding domain-containing radical SAM protein [Promethearchaeota archaeon]
MRILLTSDRSLVTNYRDNSFVGYLSSLPLGPIPKGLYNYFYPLSPATADNSMEKPNLSIRTIESILKFQLNLIHGGTKIGTFGLNNYDKHNNYNNNNEGIDDALKQIEDVKIVHPDKIVGEIKNGDIIFVSTMDPLSIGPATSSWRFMPFGSPYHVYFFWELIKRINKIRKHRKFKLIVGGAGVWQINDKEFLKKYMIDGVYEGEAEKDLLKFLSGLIRNFNDIGYETEPAQFKGRLASPGEIYPLLGPTNLYMIEISRGCGRMCAFCVPTRSGKMRSIPEETILKTADNFIKSNNWILNLQSEDTLRYGSNDFYINEDKLIGLYKDLFDKGIKRIYMTHATFSDIVGDPDAVHKLNLLLREHGHKYYGLQPGIESGSERLMRSLMAGKYLPVKDMEWKDIVYEGLKICHKERWISTASTMIGLPGETAEDLKETEYLVNKLIKSEFLFIFAPLLFVPVPMTPLGDKKRPELFKLNKMQRRVFKKMWKYTIKNIFKIWNVYNVVDYRFPHWKYKTLTGLGSFLSKVL